MNSSALFIRADASSDIGYGHVMRCLAIAQQWQLESNGPVTFVSRELPTRLSDRIHDEGYDIVRIPDSTEPFHDVNLLVALAQKASDSAIVIDGYQFDSEWQKSLRKSIRRNGLDCRTLLIDDYAHLPSYDVDVLLNQNTGVDSSLYREKVSDETRLLIGPTFALIRPEFLDGRHQREINAARRNVLISLGGCDAHEITQKVIDGIQLVADPCLSFTLLTPSTNLRVQDSRIDLVPFTDNMAELYRSASAAICAGGSSNWEMACFGLPRMVIVLAENQRAIAKSLDQLGCCRSLGWHYDVTARSIADELTRLLESDTTEMRSRNLQLVDGLGAKRIVMELKTKTKVTSKKLTA